MLHATPQWTLQRRALLLQCRPLKRHIRFQLRRSFASLVDNHQHPEPGENIHGFLLRRTKHVPELQLTAYDLEHENTGAEYLHIARDDPNNVFSVAFKTNPPDDTGVPHILEHTTLCGSQK